MTILEQQGAAAKAAARVLACAGTAKKNEALAAMADALWNGRQEWLDANAEDVAAAKEAGITAGKQFLPLTIVSDGTLLPDNLQKAGKDRLWLQRVLQEKDATLRDTWLLTVDGGDKVVLYRKEM